MLVSSCVVPSCSFLPCFCDLSCFLMFPCFLVRFLMICYDSFKFAPLLPVFVLNVFSNVFMCFLPFLILAHPIWSKMIELNYICWISFSTVIHCVWTLSVPQTTVYWACPYLPMQYHAITSNNFIRHKTARFQVLTHPNIYWHMMTHEQSIWHPMSGGFLLHRFLTLASPGSMPIPFDLTDSTLQQTLMYMAGWIQNIPKHRSDMCLENVWKRGAKWCKHVPMDLRRNKASNFGFYKRIIASAIRGYIDP